MGNLQYNAGDGKTHETANGGTAQGTFRFADNQYDYVGSDNSKASSTYNGWIDLFKYGTSGWNNGEDNYQPWTNTDDGTFLDENLSGKYANADWGVYNAISNGGETGSTPKVWRTLSKTELEYILTHYDWTLADVGENKTLCLLILPANFTSPFTLRILKPLEQGFIELTYYKSSIDETIHSDNALTLSQFQQLEDKGVIAFPNVGNIKTIQPKKPVIGLPPHINISSTNMHSDSTWKPSIQVISRQAVLNCLSASSEMQNKVK